MPEQVLGWDSGWFYASELLCMHVHKFYPVDIDECKDEDICKEGTYCLNLQGSHKCNSESVPLIND